MLMMQVNSTASDAVINFCRTTFDVDVPPEGNPVSQLLACFQFATTLAGRSFVPTQSGGFVVGTAGATSSLGGVARTGQPGPAPRVSPAAPSPGAGAGTAATPAANVASSATPPGGAGTAAAATRTPAADVSTTARGSSVTSSPRVAAATGQPGAGATPVSGARASSGSAGGSSYVPKWCNLSAHTIVERQGKALVTQPVQLLGYSLWIQNKSGLKALRDDREGILNGFHAAHLGDLKKNFNPVSGHDSW